MSEFQLSMLVPREQPIQSESVKTKKRIKVSANDDFGVKLPDKDVKQKDDDTISDGEDNVNEEIQHEQLKL